MRYLDPEYCVRARLGDSPRPSWPAALLLFRDFTASSRVLGLFEDVQPVEGRAFYNVGHAGSQPTMFEATLAGQRLIVGTACVWGGPQTSILVEELACFGVARIVGLGACGSLAPDLPQTSIVVCDQALPTDGTSRAYGMAEPVPASASLLDAARTVAEDQSLRLRSATGAGVDALYRETDKLIAGLRSQGADVVSLEVSALYAACAACGVEALWVGCVSDCLVAGEWHHWYIDLKSAAEQAALLCRDLLAGLPTD